MTPISKAAPLSLIIVNSTSISSSIINKPVNISMILLACGLSLLTDNLYSLCFIFKLSAFKWKGLIFASCLFKCLNSLWKLAHLVANFHCCIPSSLMVTKLGVAFLVGSWSSL